MPDPLRIEQKYRTTRHELALLTSPRNRLFQIIAFAELLRRPDNCDTARAYASELLALLTGIIPAVQFTGIDPRQIDRVENVLNWLTGIHDIQEPSDTLKKSRLHLKGEKELCLQHLLSRPGWASAHSFGVVIPVVEHEYLLPFFRHRFASLSFLTINLHRKSSTGKDEIHVDHLTPAEVHTDHLYVALKAARSVLLRWKRIDAGSPVAVFCSTSGEAALRGGSFGLGLGVGLVSLMLKAHVRREEFVPRKDAAFTGVLREDGGIGAVAEDGLTLKVEACYYSPVRYLCIPEQQRQLASDHLLMLEEKAGLPEGHPPIEIIPVATLEQVMNDRRLVESRHVPAAVHAARKLWQRRRPLAAVFLLALLATIGRMVYGPPDKNPTSATFDGSMMTLRNDEGQELQRIEVGSENVSIASTGHTRMVEFLDLDGDGRNEVFWTQNGSGNAEGTGTIHSRTIGEDDDRWTVTVRKVIQCPGNPVEGSDFRVFSLAACTDSSTGRASLFVLARHSSFPSLLLKLDAHTGRELSSYIHPGHIGDFILQDIDTDGTKEVLLTGVNNAYGEAFFAVLDPNAMDGHGPIQGRYVLDGVASAHERIYMLFPRTIVHEAFPDHVRWAMGGQVTSASSGTRIRLSILEFADHPNLEQERVTFHILLSNRLTPVAVETGDNFDLLAERYFSQGLIHRIPDAQYWAGYFKGIRYWNGSAWDAADPASTP
jgi:hypothetical protein